MEIADTFDFLLGSWRLTRVITDHRRGESGHFDASATFTLRDADGGRARAAYEEAGQLCFGGRQSAATRRLWCCSLGDGAVEWRFPDGRLFAPLDLRAGSWHAVHLCGDDRYEIDTVAPSAATIEERWRVGGPRKRYEAITTLRRQLGT